MVKWFLFETRIGDLLLTFVERVTGLGIVPIEQLDASREKPTPVTQH